MEPAKELRPISDHEAGLSGYRADISVNPWLKGKVEGNVIKVGGRTETTRNKARKHQNPTHKKARNKARNNAEIKQEKGRIAKIKS